MAVKTTTNNCWPQVNNTW